MDNEKRPRGRPFPKGNPGRQPGSKNKATLLTTSLAGGTGEEILRKAIEMAKGGNVAMMKFLLDRILLISAFTRAIDITDAQFQIDELKSSLDGLSADFKTDSVNSKKD